jgi:pimeloyl-ACP methyl ester carboxylesterase
MVKKLTKNINYVIPLNMNGLNGRMFKYSSKKEQPLDILFVYGHRSSLESCKGLIQLLCSLGNVTSPDLPGLGGMDSFYSIGKKPSLDNYAAYLASFMKMQHKRKKVVIVGLGYGFAVITRMLQRHPELQKNVKLVIAIKGYADDDDFKVAKFSRYEYLIITKIFSYRLSSFILQRVLLNRFMLKSAYSIIPIAKEKLSLEKINKDLSSEINLWQINDVRTFMFSTNEIMMFSNCDLRVDLPLWHLVDSRDRLIDNSRAEQHLKVIYSDYRHFKNNARIVPIFSERKSVSAWISSSLKKELKNL